MNIVIDLIPFMKINSIWIINLNVKQKTTKLLKDNMRENLGDFMYNYFSDITPKAQFMKIIINKLDFIKIKNSAL